MIEKNPTIRGILHCGLSFTHAMRRGQIFLHRCMRIRCSSLLHQRLADVTMQSAVQTRAEGSRPAHIDSKIPICENTCRAAVDLLSIAALLSGLIVYFYSSKLITVYQLPLIFGHCLDIFCRTSPYCILKLLRCTSWHVQVGREIRIIRGFFLF